MYSTFIISFFFHQSWDSSIISVRCIDFGWFNSQVKMCTMSPLCVMCCILGQLIWKLHLSKNSRGAAPHCMWKCFRSSLCCVLSQRCALKLVTQLLRLLVTDHLLIKHRSLACTANMEQHYATIIWSHVSGHFAKVNQIFTHTCFGSDLWSLTIWELSGSLVTNQLFSLSVCRCWAGGIQTVFSHTGGMALEITVLVFWSFCQSILVHTNISTALVAEQTLLSSRRWMPMTAMSPEFPLKR